MKVQELTEGPLDDLVKKVKSWVDVDSRQLDNLANQIFILLLIRKVIYGDDVIKI